MLLSTQDRQLLLPEGKIQTAGLLGSVVGGVESSYAVSFDGVDDYVSINGSPLNNLSSFSVSFWAKPSSATSGVEVNQKHSGGDRIACTLTSDGYAYIIPQSVSNYGYAQWSQFAGNWIYVCFVFDGSQTGNANRAKIYINGRESSLTFVGTIPSTTGTNTGNLEFGRRGSELTYSKGAIDDVRIYNRVLTAAEVQSIYRNSSSPPTSGLVCYFPLNEGTGTTVTDSIGGLTGTLTNGPTWQTQVCPRLRSGRDTTQSWSVSFDGGNDYLTVPSASQIVFSQTESFSVSWWISGISDNVDIIHKGTSTTQNAWIVYTFSNRIYFELRGSTISNRIVKYVGSLPSSGWHHIAFSYNGSSAAAGLVVYVDGLAQSMTTVVDALTSTIASTAALEIARTFAIGYLSGKIDDLRIYDYALSAADIAKLANGIDPGIATVGHWKLDEGSGTTAIDSSGNGNNGTLTNGPTYSGDIPQWFRPTIESSYALSCDGVDDYIRSDSVNFGLHGSTQLSAMAWVNPGVNSAGYKGVVAKHIENAGDQTFETFALCVVGGASNKIAAILGKFSPSAWPSWYATSATLSSGWSHLAMSWKRVAGDGTDMMLYVDGMPVATTFTANGYSGAFTAYENTTKLSIGARYHSAMTQPLVGLIDEVIVFNRQLTAAEIADAAAGYLVSAGLISRYKLDGNAQDAQGSNHGTEQGGVVYSSNVPGTL